MMLDYLLFNLAFLNFFNRSAAICISLPHSGRCCAKIKFEHIAILFVQKPRPRGRITIHDSFAYERGVQGFHRTASHCFHRNSTNWSKWPFFQLPSFAYHQCRCVINFNGLQLRDATKIQLKNICMSDPAADHFLTTIRNVAAIRLLFEGKFA